MTNLVALCFTQLLLIMSKVGDKDMDECLQHSVSGSGLNIAARHEPSQQKEPAVDEKMQTSGSVEVTFNLRLVSSFHLLILPPVRRCEKVLPLR